MTFKEAFELTQQDKLSLTKNPEKKLSLQNTILRYQQQYKRFISGTELENLIITKITSKDLEENYKFNLVRYDLREKACISLRGVYKQVLEYCFMENYISSNPYQQCRFKRYQDLIIQDSNVANRGYSKEEMDRILSYLAEAMRKDPQNYSIKALRLQIMCGMRRGEVPPIRWSDVSQGYVDIHQEMILVKATGEERIVNHTKTWKDRHYPITNEVQSFLTEIKISQEIVGYDGVYVFPSKKTKTGCVSVQSIYSEHHKMCLKASITIHEECIRGTHAFRRNAITNLINKSNGNVYLAAKLFGNSYAVIDNHYYLGVDINEAKKLLDT